MAGDSEVSQKAQLSSRLSSTPSPESVSLDKLEKWINDIDTQFPRDIQLKGVSYDRASNSSFGFKKDGSDFTVAAPSPLLRTDEAGKVSPHLEVRNCSTDKLTTSQRAFIEVFEKGLDLTPANVDTVLVDIATLWPDLAYFDTEFSDGTVVQALNKALQAESIQSKRVAIRILAGDQNKSLEDLQTMCQSIFLRFDEQGRNPVPKISHPNIELYVGLYSPDFDPKEEDDIKEVKNFVSKVLDSSLFKVANFTKMLKTADLNKMVDDLLAGDTLKTTPSITWNHGKILAVSGQTLMTGGINYYSEYTPGSQHDISDHAVKIQGDAALSAHRWADYFWKYLVKPSGTDHHSKCSLLNLSKDRSWYNWEGSLTSVPNSDGLSNLIKEPTLETLTVSRLGDWHGSMNKIQYPVQVIDCLRDIIINLAWHWSNLTGWHPVWGKIFIDLVDYFSDDQITKNGLVQDLGINPAAWASRYVRTKAISCANDSVVLSQQMLVQCLGDSEEAMKKFVYKANSMLTGKPMQKYDKIDEVAWGVPWDGHFWPYDLLVALAKALGKISKSTTPNLYDKDKKQFHKPSKGIFIIMTTDNQNGSHNDGWQDKISINEIKRRLRIIMQNLPYSSGGIDADQIEPALNDLLHFKRTGTTDTPKGHDLYNHSKIVVVDRRVMYVGSDNAYPSYNEEHGVWIEDQGTISG